MKWVKTLGRRQHITQRADNDVPGNPEVIMLRPEIVLFAKLKKNNMVKFSLCLIN
jgi:hypothetical protein